MKCLSCKYLDLCSTRINTGMKVLPDKQNFQCYERFTGFNLFDIDVMKDKIKVKNEIDFGSIEEKTFESIHDLEQWEYANDCNGYEAGTRELFFNPDAKQLELF